MNLQILSFNIHKGIGWNTHKTTIPQLKSELDKLQPDILFLQEILDSQLDALTSEIWPYSAYGENVSHPRKCYGNAVLSKYPVTFNKNLDLSMHRYERRGMLH